MKLEFLAHESPYCPLIRLYRFDEREAKDLRAKVAELARGMSMSVAVHNLEFITPVFGCELVLIVGEKDRGVVETHNSRLYTCILTKETWNTVSGLFDQYCMPRATRDSVWLDQTSHISLLLAPTSKL